MSTLERQCAIEGCERRYCGKGLCEMHLKRLRIHGDTADPRPTTAERFWSKVNKDGPTPAHRPELGKCWEWDASRSKSGYGSFGLNGRSTEAHRVAILLSDGELPPQGMHTDHLCRNHACVRRTHLEVVTPQINTRRGIAGEGSRSRARAVTHCPRGHAYDEANTYTALSGGYLCRGCRQCRREASRRHAAKKRGDST